MHRIKNKIEESLIEKYNVPAPRYTSYPTVPFWENDVSEEIWRSALKNTFLLENTINGISLYIHLPYCESLCTYCGCNTRITVNHSVELPYIEAVIEEWKLYQDLFVHKPVISEIHLGGGTPAFFSPENLGKLLHDILKNSVVHPQYNFSFEAHPKNTSLEHLKVLFGFGFKRISIGVQDLDEKILRSIHRDQTFEQVKECVENARAIGFTSVNFDLIYGLPFQTINTQKKTLNKIMELLPDRVAYYSYAHVPWLKKAQRSFTEEDLPANEDKLNLYFLGKELFNKAGLSDIGMDHFALSSDELFLAQKNNKLHRNFMGFTTTQSKLLIGLGVSAISDAWFAYIQNNKTIEGYFKEINNKKFAIHNGHLLTEIDLLVRKKILDLMCRHKTDISDFPDRNGLIKRLEKYKTDDLIEMNDMKIMITEKGKQFIRNICMELDLRLKEKKMGEQLFSKVV